MTTGPFLLERITKQFWTDYEAWSRQYITPAHRRLVGIGMAVFGVFVAGFLAFDDERAKLEKANEIIASVKSPAYIPYENIPQSVFDLLATGLGKCPNKMAYINFAVIDRSATVVANKLQAAMKKAGLSGQSLPAGLDSDDDTGIELMVRDHDNPLGQSQCYISAFKDSGIPFRTEEFPSDPENAPFGFYVYVGPRAILKN